jgi:cytochrome c-type biogenesis protein CcmF
VIPELGQFALVTALCLALVQGTLPLAGAAAGNLRWMELGRSAARAQCAFLIIAFVALSWSFAHNDFSVLYVSQNSNSALPLHYRLSAVWGAHEGSLLLWSLILGIWTTAVSFLCGNLPRALAARVLGVMGLVSSGFLLFLLMTSNPFTRQFPAPADGGDLNPLLQDPGLIIHPPMLYAGYVGFSVAFAFAIAALLEGRLDPAWARWTRPWTTAAWIFLTLGIALGSWWAYYELGWGGWWFWDPVENASFMPWLLGTALIHSLAATEKRGVFRHWTVLLAICAFALSLLGTFLVRSGVLTSVHAFANDPARGVFILALLGVVIGGSLVLYAVRAPGAFGGAGYAPVSRETFLLTNSALLAVAAASILLGTLYPLAIDVMGGKLSVGPPYFNSVFVPLMVPLLAVLGLGVTSRWRRDEPRRIWQNIRYILLAAAVLGTGTLLMLTDSAGVRMALAVVLAAWIIATTLASLRGWLHAQGTAGRALPPRAQIGMSLAHVGLAVTILGIAASSQYSVDLHRRMSIGDSYTLSGYRFELGGLRELEGPNYRATQATFNIFRGDRRVDVLHSQKRFYNVRGMVMTEAGIDAGLFRDLYVSLGEPLDGGDWSVRLHVKPLVRWIWLGALLMAIGGLTAVSDRRYRVPAAARGAAAPPATDAAVGV